MRQFYIINICLFFSVSFLGCKNEIHSEKEFTNWIKDEKNGCIVEKNINGIALSIYYLPNEYVTAKNQSLIYGNNKSVYDSLLNYNKYNLNFLMIFQKSNKKDNTDIIFENIASLDDYSERIMTLNFEMERNVVLKTKNGEFKPVLSSLENTYGLSKDIKINLLFSPNDSRDELINTESFDFVYEDKMFGIGTVHCFFDRKKIENNLPEFQVE